MGRRQLFAVACALLCAVGASFGGAVRRGLRCASLAILAQHAPLAPAAAGALDLQDLRAAPDAGAVARMQTLQIAASEAGGASATADASGESLRVTGPNGAFGALAPPRFEFAESQKPLKTHAVEVGPYSSKATKGFKFGITVDPVKINDIRNFGTPQEVLDKVVGVESSKDGTLEVTKVGAREAAAATAGRPPFYELEYVVDSTRGLNHFWSSVTIQEGKLYVMTVQAKEATLAEVEQAAKDIRSSFFVQ